MRVLRPLTADIDLTRNADGCGDRLEAESPSGGRRAGHRRRDAADQGGALHREIPAGDGEGVARQIDPRGARAGLTG